MAQRPTTAFETTLGTKVEVKNWLSSSEAEKIVDFISPHSEVDPSSGKVEMKLKDISTMLKFQKLLAEIYVYKIGDDTENLGAIMDDMQDEDVAEIRTYVTDLYQASQKKTLASQTKTGRPSRGKAK